MVSMIVDKVPADIKVIIFPLFFPWFCSSEDLVSFRDTVPHKMIDAMATIKRDIGSPPFLCHLILLANERSKSYILIFYV